MGFDKEERRELRSKGWSVNIAETEAAIFIQRHGGKYVRRGYPDFTILKDGEIFGFIEVKPHGRKRLRVDQERFERFCKRLKIPFLKWCPEDGEAAIVAFLDM